MSSKLKSLFPKGERSPGGNEELGKPSGNSTNNFYPRRSVRQRLSFGSIVKNIVFSGKGKARRINYKGDYPKGWSFKGGVSLR